MSLGDWESDFSISESTYEEEVERWKSYFRPSSSSDERTVDHSDQHSPSQPPPDASSPTKSTIASPRRSSESLAVSGATIDSRPLFVDGIISQLAELRKLYQSRSENPSSLRCAQWPIPRNKTKRSGEKEPIFRHCVCKAKVVSARQIASSGLTCCDPACAVPSGWHHERCVSEEERVAGRSNGLWICPACLVFRQTEGFPEFASLSLEDDRHRWLKRNIAMYYPETGLREDSESGLTDHERTQANIIDQRLKITRKWPPFLSEDL